MQCMVRNDLITAVEQLQDAGIDIDPNNADPVALRDLFQSVAVVFGHAAEQYPDAFSAPRSIDEIVSEVLNID